MPAQVIDLAQDASCIFLVSLAEPGAGGSKGPNSLEVDASAGVVTAPSMLEDGRVAEVRLWAGAAAVGSTITLAITVQQDDEAHSTFATATVTEPIGAPDDRLETGTTLRGLFIPWLASAHPELGIDETTEWAANPLRPHILEVSYSMFLSDVWELVVWWHVTIPPYDWARMYLRRRTTETAPSFAAEVHSVSGGDAAQEMTPPEEVWR